MSKLNCIEEFSEAAFLDKRLFYRANKILRDCLNNPSGSIPEFSSDYHQAKAVYRFLDNENIKWESLLQDTTTKLAKQVSDSDEMILVAQDTTSFDFTTKPKTQDLGYLEKKHMYGIKVHSSLAITTQGSPLGLLSQIIWTRDIQDYGKKKDKAKKPIQEKESYIWLKSLHNLQDLGLKKFILVGDRESDIFDLFNSKREPNQHLLVRSSINRKTDTIGTKLWDSLDTPNYDFKVEIPRSRKQKARIAQCSLRFGRATIIQKNTNIRALNPETNQLELKSIKKAGSVQVNLIILEEKEAPTGDTPILWRLITSLPITDQSEAQKAILYYKYRWLIEEFHYTLKSGCEIEELHLKEKEKIFNILMIYNLVACKILNLCYLARTAPNQKATKNAFTIQECLILYNYHTVKNPNLLPLEQRDKPPNQNNDLSIPTIQSAIIQVAKLGGFMARKTDGSPGVKTIWKGLRKLAIMEEYHELIFVGKG